MRQYVIIGGGPAGVYAATSIRAKDPAGTILILDRDQDRPYYRTELDTYIAGSTPEAELPLNPEQFYHEQQIELRQRTIAARVCPVDRAVELTDGSRVAYDALLLAPGSAPVPASFSGRDLQGVMTVRTWEDARHVIQAIGRTDRSVVVVGGGVLGLILAEGIRLRGKAVVLLERERTLWTPLLDEPASLLIQKGLQEAGIEVRMGEVVSEAGGDGGRLQGIRTSQGHDIETELIVVAIGARPDIRFLEGSGVRTDRGILIDHEFRTNIPEIFAAGDAAQAYDPLTGLFRVVTSWNNAVEQGRLAGASMAGGGSLYKGVIASNSESFCGVRVSVMGLPQATGKGLSVLTGRNDEKGLYRKLILRQDTLIGAILVGNTSGEGMMKKSIVDAKPLTATDAKSKFLTGMIIEETQA